VKSLLIKREGPTEQTGVVPEARGIVESMRWVADAQRRTGQRTASPVFRCVRKSICVPFFWLTNVIVTNSVREERPGASWGITRLDFERNRMPESVIILVLPGVGVLQYSQDLMAKKKAPQMMSAACR
jgi:hypothetical protein